MATGRMLQRARQASGIRTCSNSADFAGELLAAVSAFPKPLAHPLRGIRGDLICRPDQRRSADIPGLPARGYPQGKRVPPLRLENMAASGCSLVKPIKPPVIYAITGVKYHFFDL